MLGKVSSVADIELLRPIAEVIPFEGATLRDPARRPNLVQENYFAGVHAWYISIRTALFRGQHPI